MKVSPKTALLSVSDKKGLVPFARFLESQKIKLIATGGTEKILKEAGIKVSSVSSLTGFPEIFGGRVKSIHPNILGGILGQRDKDEKEAQQNKVVWIDMVVCNLYPFQAVARDPKSTLSEKIENIDIGGPTMIRAAAKNNKWVTVVINPKDYQGVQSKIKCGGLDSGARLSLATKAFGYCAEYDGAIFEILETKKTFLRYGENPHQGAFVVKKDNHSIGLPQATQLQGKKLSYNNFLDGEAALLCLGEFKDSSCVIVKHNSPCGIGSGKTIKQAFSNALSVDPLSAFGGIVAMNKKCDLITAKEINKVFFEIIIAPSFDVAALELFSKKKNLRILQLKKFVSSPAFVRSISGGEIGQDTDSSKLLVSKLKNPTNKKPTAKQLESLELAWKAVKHAKSNAIVVAHNNKIISISGGQTSRVEAVKYALTKNALPGGAVVASDAFFPFRDSIDLMSKYGISCIVQPGGSIKDGEVVAACNEHEISMVFTSFRVFKH
jgi:phosphoribosylaminoimidazolecarboxamide formyltransferase/IMP cyclohydrolase|tara:strand:- start:9004 stop:10482 length:1479 start_codon:yes stop_codon:yes gene_type:complete